MPRTPLRLPDLTRDELVRVGLEYMLVGHLYDRALMPQAITAFGMGEMLPLSVAEWRGASPNYTRRMRRLMRIEGDDVAAICKALQLDVGFTHQYMDVAYEITDDHHATFWLNHCGALMDVEPMGEELVVTMCHHIEDPTFDATALATNPRARVRPVHRPPRRPADRHPHCHWTITIDPAADPIAPHPLTLEVAELPLARVPNERPVLADDEDGLDDYAGPFDPAFSLGALSRSALVAVAREFALQCALLSAAAELHLRAAHGPTAAREVLAAQWEGVCWVVAQRLAACLGLGGGIDAVAQVVALHPAIPPGIEVHVEVLDDRSAGVTFSGPGELVDPGAPGWVGLVAADEPRGLAAIAGAVEPRAVVGRTGPHTFAITVDPAADPATAPRSAELTRISTAADWAFTPVELR
jgi:hypothetical protein